MTALPTEIISSTGLIGGYAAARYSGKRQLGGVVLIGAGALAATQWTRQFGAPAAAALTGLYAAAFVASHPLAKKLDPWPSVFTVNGVVTAASLLTRALRAR